MPLDPSIILGVKAPAQEDPLAAYGKVMQIQNAQQAQQANTQKLQEGALDLQEKQRGIDFQKTFSDALRKHTTVNSDGTLTTDWGGVQGVVTNAGYGPEAMRLSTERASAAKAGYDLIEAQNKADAAKAQTVGRILGALPQVDQSATPDVQAVQKSAWNAAAPTAIASLVSQGHMTQQDGSGMIQQIQQAGGWNPQFDALVKQKQMEGLTTEQQVAHVQAGVTAAREGRVADATIRHTNLESDKLTADTADKARSDAAALLSQSNSGADYFAKWNKLTPDLQAKLPRPEDLGDWGTRDKSDIQEQILTSGMNAEQLATHQDRQAAQVTRDLAQQSLSESRKANELFKQFMMQGQPSPAQKAATVKLDGLAKAEAPLWKQAAQLATALGDGSNVTTFIGQNGGSDTMKSKTLDADAAKGLVADMQTRLKDAQAQLTNVINKKYDLMEKQGMPKTGDGAPEVSREDALAAVAKLGLAGKPSNAPAQTAKPPASSAATAAAGVQPPQQNPGGSGEVHVSLPNGKTKVFPNKKAADDFAAAAGLTFTQPK